MKVCVISTPIFRLYSGGLLGYGGLEQLAWQIAKGLAELGHEVSLVAPDGSVCPGVEIISIGEERKVNEQQAYSKYWQELLKQDVIIDHSWNKWAYILKEEGRLKAPILGVCHAPVDTMYRSLPPVEKPCFVCISQDQANHFEALFSKDVRVARNGIDLSVYQPLNVKRTDRFLFLARFSTVKGPDLAIEACKQAGVGLDLVGDTQITNEPDFLNKCLGMVDGKKIKFVGSATRGECVYWYSQAHCFLHPNQRFREPLGLAPIEAMACGLPVIAWKYGALRETVKHNETGYLCSSLGEMVHYIQVFNEKTEGERRVIRQDCQEWAQEFSIEKMVKRYEELCKEAMDTGGW